MAASPSSLSSETDVKIHPYQLHTKPGPKGAFEARQSNGGFYVRVDMPGVPPDGVKLVKYSDTRTVTFTGKAPKHWSCDFSERVYGGYVVLDRDPNEVQVEMTVKNGCFRLFFADAEGALHFLGSKNRAKKANGEDHDHDPGSMVFGDTDECGHDEFVQYAEEKGGMRKMRLHSSQCSCCKQKNVDWPGENPSVSRTLTLSHINPYLLHGAEGVEENKLVVDETGERLYLRVDLPGLEAKNCSVAIKDYISVLYGGESKKEHQVDEGGRVYLGSLILQCTCCKIVDVEHEFMHGVLRVLVQKCNINIPKFIRSQFDDMKGLPASH